MARIPSKNENVANPCQIFDDKNSNYNFKEPINWFLAIPKNIKQIRSQLDLVPIPILFRRAFTARVNTDEVAVLEEFFPEDAAEIPDATCDSNLSNCINEELKTVETSKGEPVSVFAEINRLLADFLKDREVNSDRKIVQILRMLRRLHDLLNIVEMFCPEEDDASDLTTLQNWLKDLIGKLESIIQFVEESESESIQDQRKFLESLNLVPDVLTEDPFRFGRELTTLFAEESDLVNQILTTFQPGLQNNYYQALAAKLELKNPNRLPDPSELHVFRVKAAPYGAKLPILLEYDESGKIIDCLDNKLSDFVDFTDSEGIVHITFDADYPEIASGQWIVIEWPSNGGPRSTVIEGQEAETSPFGDSNPDRIVRRVKAVQTTSKQGYGEVTLATLDKPWLDGGKEDIVVKNSPLVTATIYAQSELLPLSRRPIISDETGSTDVKGREIHLNGLYDGLQAGRWLSITGERKDIPDTEGILGSELARIAGVKQFQPQYLIKESETDDEPDIALDIDTIHTVLQLVNPLTFRYRRDTVQIQANVAHATHGETREEILGSGDGSRSNQSFMLKQKPLTYTSAPTISGIESSLEVRINDVRWQETDNLIWLEQHDRGYMTRTDNEQNSTVVFGDGQKGTRLPSGVENVKAVYRNGIGLLGNVEREQISLLASKPLGVKAVINPLSATGGANPETRDQARRNTPLALMALDRLVSLQDYADFTRTFAGIAKAVAVQITNSGRQFIHITIAGMDDIPISEESDLFKNLCKALHQFGTLNLPIVVETRQLILLLISANIRLHPDYQWKTVEEQIRSSLSENFSFVQRQLGQIVYVSEVMDVIQQVPGVIYVDVDLFEGIRQADAKSLETLQDRLKEIEIEKERPSLHIPTSVGVVNEGSSGIAAHLVYLSPAVPDMLILKEVA
jgi:predicted phage baseplate assembly protein